MCRARKCLAANLIWVAGLLCLLSPSRALAQRPGQNSNPAQASISVFVRFPDGSPFDQTAVVTLRTNAGGFLGVLSLRAGTAEFDGLAPGQYVVDVAAPSYEKVESVVEISSASEHPQAYLVMKRESSGNTTTGPAQPPILAPKAQKELAKALEALRANSPEEAKKQLVKISASTTGNPDVNYAWGVYYAEVKDWTTAKTYWQKAIQVYPSHALSLAALGQAALQDRDVTTAISYLQRAVEAAPSSWSSHQLLAEAYLEHQEYDQAQKHAERAIELGKARATGAQAVLAAVAKRNASRPAESAPDSSPTARPSGPSDDEAGRFLESLGETAVPAPAQLGGAFAQTNTQPVQPGATAIQPSATPVVLAKMPIASLVPEPKWMPPNVDESIPPVETGIACPLQKVQEEVGKRVRAFVDGVNRISATEALEHENIDRYGFPSGRESRTYSYVASLQETKPGTYAVEEYRNGTMGLEVFPGQLATRGLTSLVMVFHPAYSDEFEMTCEGLSRWHGGLAWQVYFRQRPDKPARLREYRVARQGYPVWLRGRAWIGASNFQVISMETDLVAPLPQIRLNAEHVSIEYTPVKFRKDHEELWLPQSAEMFMELGNRRVHRRHYFSNYMLFSVDDKEKVSTPSVNAQSDPAAPDNQPNR